MALTNAERLASTPLVGRIEISTHVADAPWPVEAPSRQPSLGERVMSALYWLCTPTFELPLLLNFGQLNERVCRGAQPGKIGFQLLKGMGVDTVINLRVEAPGEEAQVRALGMDYHYFPMDPIGAPTHEQTLAFLREVTNPRHGRVFFHCYHGADRTGVLAACYRVAHDGWSLTEAAAEMDKHKFHRVFQAAKLEYLLEFGAYWKSLGADERARVLHQA
jgi:protein tyrosine phosphatase (PTP) superfamily phosphohydrolase (DUF442 family)